MRARFHGVCRLCEESIHPGQEISILLKRWVHPACKAAEIARRVEAAGGPIVLPEARTEEGPAGPVGVKTRDRQGFRRVKRRIP